MNSRYVVAMLATVATLALAGGATAPAAAQGDFDTPTVTVGMTGLARQTLTITAGPSGTPAGFTVWWATKSDFLANNSEWWLYGDSRQGEAFFSGAPSLNVFAGEAGSFSLGPNQSITVEIGDLMDESGVAHSAWRASWGGELEYGTEYVFCAFANASLTVYQSAFSDNYETTTIQTQNCTFTQGYWKNHEENWPASCLPMTLGGNAYTKAELLAILGTSVGGNGAISLAHQLIATKLNICMGADPSAVAACVVTADALLSACGLNKVPPSGTCNIATATTSAMTQCLDNYNNGLTGPGHCPPTANKKATWGEIKVLHR